MRPNPLSNNSRNAKGAQTAYVKGQAAARAGQPESVCPYANTPSSPNEVSFGRSWRKKWLAGYRSIKKEAELPPP